MLHFRVFASLDKPSDRIVQRFKMERDSALEYVNHWDRKYQRFVSILFEKDATSRLYDGVFNTDSMSPDAWIDAMHSEIT